MKWFHRSMHVSMLLAASTVLLGCEADRSVSAPDGLQPQFAKPGGPPPSTPITFDLAGGFLASGQDGAMTETASTVEVNGGGGGGVTRKTNFQHTHAAGIAACVAKPVNADMQDLFDWLVGDTRIGSFHMTVDRTIPASASNQVGTMSWDPDSIPRQHVDVGNFSLMPGLTATVVETETDVFEFTGGAVRMWDRYPTRTKDQRTLVCPNLDVVTVTITR